MAKAKVAVTIDSALLKVVDAQVKRREFPSRSAAIESALREASQRKGRKTEEEEYLRLLALLDPEEERALAEERYVGDVF